MQAKKIKILLIEDDYFLAGIYLAKFELEGFEIILAKDGEQGLEFADSKNPDIILLDIFLPKKDGFDVLRDLKKSSVTKNIPVIIMTNLSENKNVKKCFDLGAVDYIIKSNFLPNEIVEKVKQTLSKGRAK